MQLLADDVATTGGAVGGLSGLLMLVYVLYDKFKTRRAQARRDDIEAAERQLGVDAKKLTLDDQLRASVVDAYQQLLAAHHAEAAARKAAHDADLAEVRGRIAELEAREARCLDRIDDLRRQLAESQADRVALHAQVEGLRAALARAGIRPGPGPGGELIDPIRPPKET
jgi:uncharacterized coiled-coil protein SlyX